MTAAPETSPCQAASTAADLRSPRVHSRLLDRHRAAVLVALLIVALALRFSRLEHEALWNDEILTCLLAAGRSSDNLPLDRVLDTAAVRDMFRLNPNTGLASIARAVATDSTHPPLSFWLSHLWLKWMWDGRIETLAWQMRALSVLTSGLCLLAFPAVAAAASGRKATRLALLSAALFAVSPLSVYLAQQARYYHLAMLCVLVSLAGHARVCRDLAAQRHPRTSGLILWAAGNSVGFYVSYLTTLAWCAQIVVCAWWARRHRAQGTALLAVVGAALAVMASWMPALPLVISHMGRPEVRWIHVGAGWGHALMGVLSAVLSLTVFAAVPLRGGVSLATLVLGVVACGGLGWIGTSLAKGRPAHGRLDFNTAWAMALAAATIALLIVLGWITRTALTSVLRYHLFVLPPALLAVAALLDVQPPRRRARLLSGLIALGLAGSLVVVSGAFFARYLEPRRTARQMIASSKSPTVLVWEYSHLNHVAGGLSVAMELLQTDARAHVAFLRRPTNGDWSRAVGMVADQVGRAVDLWSTARPASFDVPSDGCQRAPLQIGRVSGQNFYHLVCR